MEQLLLLKVIPFLGGNKNFTKTRMICFALMQIYLVIKQGKITKSMARDEQNCNIKRFP